MFIFCNVLDKECSRCGFTSRVDLAGFRIINIGRIEKKKRTKLEGKLADRPGFFIQSQLFLQFMDEINKASNHLYIIYKRRHIQSTKINGNSSVPVLFF